MFVGLVAGLLAVGFRWALNGSELLRTHLILWVHYHPTWAGWYLSVLARSGQESRCAW